VPDHRVNRRRGAPVPVSRHFTVATFVVGDGQLLLHFHAKLHLWLPPGGHVEPDELPDEAAVREVFEETAIRVELIGERGVDVAYPRQLVRPVGIQLERIGAGEGYHEHIDLIYFARPLEGLVPPRGNGEGEGVGWYPISGLAALGAPEDVVRWAERAESVVGVEPSVTASAPHPHGELRFD
jgi:ADP-ribose pyrophosphatase YjhB (NUDIX family)